MNFYSVIIGTELLNGRRKDAHFEFLNNELLKRGWVQKASFIIDDKPSFIEDIFKFIKNDPDAVLFSFGGIGATPDDFTRVCSANAFTGGKMETNLGAKKAILDRFKDEAYPHRINMATLPTNAGLLENIVTNVPGYYLEDRYFFMPGFPSMSQHMVVEALDKFYPKNKPKYRLSLNAQCSENLLVDTMQLIPQDIEMSSLPQIDGDKRNTIISIASYDEDEAKKYFKYFTDYLEQHNITYTREDS
jgi:molybdopterin-biosynthesis enzyme MoeA-like protein